MLGNSQDGAEHDTAQTPRLIKRTRDSGSTGGTAARLGLVGDREHFCTATGLCNLVLVSLSQYFGGRKEEAYPKAAFGEKSLHAAKAPQSCSFAQKK